MAMARELGNTAVISEPFAQPDRSIYGVHRAMTLAFLRSLGTSPSSRRFRIEILLRPDDHQHFFPWSLTSVVLLVDRELDSVSRELAGCLFSSEISDAGIM